VLLGRTRERQALEEILDTARRGESAVLALVGEPGIGKSSLLELAAGLASDMNVLRARGVAAEAQIPFAGLYELLRPALGGLDRIPAPQAAALESALALRPAHAEDRFAVAAATLSLLASHAEETPLLVLLDDVHWLDGSSADALLFAIRRLLAEPIAVVLTAREGEPSLLDGAGLPVRRVEGLDERSAAKLLRQAAPTVISHLHRETGGNPLALLELAGEPLADVAPDAPIPVVASVARVYAHRAAALPPETRQALLLAAATDRGELALFARAASSFGVEIGHLAPAEQAGLVTIDGSRLEFRHPLARSAIYAEAPADQRRQVHRALAQTLADVDADRRAWHLALAAAGPDERASSALEQAAIRARDRSAYEVSSHAFERAARLAGEDARRGELLFDSAEAAWLGGLADRAVALLDEAAQLSDGVDVQHLRGHIAVWRGPLADGRATLLAGAVSAEPAQAVVMLAEAGMAAFYAGDSAGMLECAARAREIADRDGSEWTAFFAATIDGMALVFAGEGDRGADTMRRAVRVIERSETLRADPRLLVWAAMGPLWLREAGTGRGLIDSALDVARTRSAVGILPQLLKFVAIEHATTDRWPEAQAAFDETIRLARETDQRVVLVGALARSAWLNARLGREGAARAQAEEALATARENGIALGELWSLAALGELELVLGNAGAALSHVEELQRRIDELEIGDVDVVPGAELVELYLRHDRPADALAAATAFERRAADKGQPWAIARALRARGLIAADDEADAWFEQAREHHARTPDVFESARTELAHGARMRRSGRRVDARARLRAAIDVFDELGAAPWAELARTELAATGETPRRREASSLDELTPQELQISLLLAEGRTTREAAAALFLSPKTIEYHLRNAYRKLAIHSRDELREAMRGVVSRDS
jgi:DNA-binding CsgD family transcriptional regulator